jgi:hypothetical protein
MKKFIAALIVALALGTWYLPTPTQAQCNGIFPPNSVCGNPATAISALPKPTSPNTFTVGPAGISGQTQFNNGGSFDGYTPNGDCTVATATGFVSCPGLAHTASAVTFSSSVTFTGLVVHSSSTTFNAPTTFASPIFYQTNIQATSYTIQTSDCGGLVEINPSPTAVKTVTLPSTTGFGFGCAITVKNADAVRGKILSGFPSDLYRILWPLQTAQVENASGVWVSTINPGRWQAVPQFFIDNGGSDTANDGLGTGSAGGFATMAHCAVVVQAYIDTQNQGSPQCSHTASQNDSEFIAFFYPTHGGGTIIFNSATPGTQWTWTCPVSSYCLQFGDGALVGLKDILFITNPSSNGVIFGHNYGVLDANQNITFNANTGQPLLSCDFDTHFNINNGFTYESFASFLFQGCQGSRWNINGNVNSSGSTTVNRPFVFSSGSLATFQGNVVWGTTGLSISVGLVSGNSVLNNLAGSSPPGGAPTPTTGGQYCTSLC